MVIYFLPSFLKQKVCSRGSLFIVSGVNPADSAHAVQVTVVLYGNLWCSCRIRSIRYRFLVGVGVNVVSTLRISIRRSMLHQFTRTMYRRINVAFAYFVFCFFIIRCRWSVYGTTPWSWVSLHRFLQSPLYPRSSSCLSLYFSFACHLCLCLCCSCLDPIWQTFLSCIEACG